MNRADVIEYLGSLGADELGDLIDELQRRLGLPAPASQTPRLVMGAPLVMGTPDVDECSVVLVGFAAARKLDLVRIVRDLKQIGLMDAKRLVESVPATLGEFMLPTDADDLADRLRSAGAIVEVRR